MPEAHELHDITVIGGGPAGLFAAYYAGVRGLTVKIIDSLPDIGGQLTAMYPEKYIYDVPGFPRILARDLVTNLVAQVAPYAPTLCLGERVEHLHPLEPGRLRLSTDRAHHETRALIITAGAGMYSPRRLQGAERFEGRGLLYTVKRTDDFRGKAVLVIGGGNSAVDWALHLEPVARAITLIHRRDTFRAHDDSVRRLLASRATVKLWHQVKELRGDDQVREAVIVNTRTQVEERLQVDAVLACLGFSSDLGAIANWGLDLVGGDSIRVNTRMETNIPGVYAAGDVAEFPGKVKLIVTGFGEAVTAVDHAARSLDPGRRAASGSRTAITKRREVTA